MTDAEILGSLVQIHFYLYSTSYELGYHNKLNCWIWDPFESKHKSNSDLLKEPEISASVTCRWSASSVYGINVSF